MLTGIMSIFEMGLSLTGQSLLPSIPDTYVPGMKSRDEGLLLGISGDNEEVFKNSVAQNGLCSALGNIDSGTWELIEEEGTFWHAAVS